MARNLASAGFDVRTWNRSGGSVDGATACRTIEEAVRPAEVVITMLSEDAAVRAVTFGDGKLVASLMTGGMHIGMSTISVDARRRTRHGSRRGRPALRERAGIRPSRNGGGREAVRSSRAGAPPTSGGARAPLRRARAGHLPDARAEGIGARQAVRQLHARRDASSRWARRSTLGEKGGVAPEQLLGHAHGNAVRRRRWCSATAA